MIKPRGFPGGASSKEPACWSRRCKRQEFNPWVGKTPWRRAWQPTAVFLPGECLGQRNLAGCSPQGCKESDATHATQHAHKHSQVWGGRRSRGRPRTQCCGSLALSSDALVVYAGLLSEQLWTKTDVALPHRDLRLVRGQEPSCVTLLQWSRQSLGLGKVGDGRCALARLVTAELR